MRSWGDVDPRGPRATESVKTIETMMLLLLSRVALAAKLEANLAFVAHLHRAGKVAVTAAVRVALGRKNLELANPDLVYSVNASTSSGTTWW